MVFVKAAGVNDLKDGQGKIVNAGGKTMALFRQGGNFYAIDNTCLHQGGPLGEGELNSKVVTCPWHGWQYDIASGVCQFNPSVKVPTYKVKVEGGNVMVEV